MCAKFGAKIQKNEELGMRNEELFSHKLTTKEIISYISSSY